MEIKAFCKVNLFLSVGAKRADGYHEIESVMQSISLFDRLTFSRTDSETIELSCSKPFVPTDERNLVRKAADKFFAFTGIVSDGLRIHLEKNVPVGAGLGGGSSDAAATLSALNTLYTAGLSEKDLISLASSIGADVAFFLRGGTQLACGIGEKLSPLPAMPPLPMLIVKPSFSVSTPKAYAAFDAFGAQPEKDSAEMQRALEKEDADALCAALFNSLEAPVVGMHPKIGEIRDAMRACGALGAMMSGAGSAVFGIFRTEKEAANARRSLPNTFGKSWICRPVK